MKKQTPWIGLLPAVAALFTAASACQGSGADSDSDAAVTQADASNFDASSDASDPGCNPPAAGQELALGETSFTGGGRFNPGLNALATVRFSGFSPVGLEVFNFCSNSLIRIDTGDSPKTFIAWSPDELTLYYTDGTGISSVPASGGTPTVIVADADTMDLSPDGTTLVYSEGGALFTWDLAGSSETDLSQAGVFPRYSPDGSEIAFSGGGDLNVLTLAGGATSAVTTIGGAFQPHDWLPNGDFIIASDLGIEQVTRAGVRSTILTVTGGTAQDVDVSPDGKMLAYRKNGQRPTFVYGL